MRRRESEMGVGREGETGGKEEVPLEDQMLEQSGYTSHGEGGRGEGGGGVRVRGRRGV